jgi:hypothetical protein
MSAGDEMEASEADRLIARFFSDWAPKLQTDRRSQFHVDFLRVVQQIVLEAAWPYHMLMRDALSRQPILPRAPEGGNDNG